MKTMKKTTVFILIVTFNLTNLNASDVGSLRANLNNSAKTLMYAPSETKLSLCHSNKAIYKLEYDSQNIMLSAGIGNSYGFGLGLRTQYRFGDIVGYGFHIGVGTMFQDATNLPIGFSLGGKFFYYKNLYLNVQYGVNWLDTKIIRAPNTYSITTYKAVLGPSILIGGDFIMGDRKKFGLNIGGGVGLVHGEVQPAFDVGFIIKF